MTTVFCIDDNADLVDVLSLLLRSMELNPYTALSGEEGLVALKRGDVKPDIILLDIMMEPMDGWETLRNIRSDPNHLTVPVVMLTGKFPTMEELCEFGPMVDGYLMKPFAFESLSKKISEVLEWVRLREEFIDRARGNRADERLLQEYRRLASSVRTLKQLKGIIKNEAFDEESLHIAEKRLTSLEEHLKRLGVAVS